ncbi:MAG: class I SAM-dependent DNA methyltransferase [Burkholderiaceae bacterium]|nr:class I SAM-dependent DNA methyltransferase [Burkholderiaceae bacterium]
MPTEQDSASAFIARWQGVAASELSTSQSFVIELCELLGVARPHATAEQDYMFERPVTFQHGDGSSSAGRIDCYRRGAFIWESKKLKPGLAAVAAGSTSKAFDDALLRARAQAEAYARALPASEGRPPFLVVVDVGHVIELYAEFTRSGATYTPFPDPRSHRIRLADLADDVLRQRLRALWADPMSLDPARVSARVTRQVAGELAELARSLEAAGHPAEQVAGFLTRCLFSMFAEDVGLLPRGADGSGSFLALLKTHRDQPATLVNMLRVFWAGMDSGGFNAAIAQDVLRFNGKLFKGANASGYVLPLGVAQVDGLLRAAGAKWQDVEPAIFGTLLERALDPAERHALGAHYTPRAYVERLVLPTVVEPLRADWANAQAAALLLVHEAEALDGRKRDAKLEEARTEIRRFHHQLCTTRVLDPACGSGNFLYVTLEHLKRLEGEVLNQLEAQGETQDKLALEGETVTLQQLRGIEINERAAALAELVLWIGWLQWHLRTRGPSSVAEPVIHDYGNIECRDAVLAYDRQEIALDANGRPIARWDGKTFKKHIVTGEDVPNETAQVPQWKYVNARRAEWPQVDFVVGNPPFIGNKRMRDALGDGYVQALRSAWTDVPDTADFVMYWWDHAAESARAGAIRSFGFITTNSLRQTFNRKLVARHLAAKQALSLRFAIPDHPWVDGASGADVRIAMTVGARGDAVGELLTVIDEQPDANGEVAVTFQPRKGEIHADLNVGPKVGAAQRLAANAGLSFQGMNLVGKGFRLSDEEVRALGYDPAALPKVIQPHCNARDLMQGGEHCFVIDLFGLSADEALRQHPALYQWLLDRVKPERDHNNRESRRRNWWLFGEPVGRLRNAWRSLPRVILTPETSKHRVFAFQSMPFCPDHKLYAICCDDAFVLGVLSSTVHAQWALRAGGTLEDRPTWTNTTTFLPFPFPHEDDDLLAAARARVADLAERIDAHRKARQAVHATVTLTGLYNVLDKLRRDEPLSASDKALHEQGLVSVLRSLHDELDAAVLQAYGWCELGPVPWTDDAARSAWTEILLERLVALNAKRAAEEAQGTVRWLRPEFQNPAQPASAAEAAPEQASIDLPDEAEAGETAVTKSAATRQPWPATLPEQMRAVADMLAAASGAHDEAALAERFSGRGPWKKRLPQILQTLEALGRARREGERWRA